MYTDEFGVRYSKDKKKLIRCPQNFEGKYVIPAGVEQIGADAFNGCHGLTSVVFSDDVFAIRERAFMSCDKLTSIALPYSMCIIEKMAFADCSNLCSISLNDVGHIGEAAFANCKKLKKVVLPPHIYLIEANAFENTSIEQIWVTIGMKEYFSSMEGLENLTHCIRDIMPPPAPDKD